MIDRPNSASSWSQTMNRIHSQTSDNAEKPNSVKRLSAHLTSSTKLMPLQDENHVPRKRNNSLIPIELRMNNNNEGGRECATLASVFGVPEYSDSKVFWDRQQKQTQLSRPGASDKYGYVSVNSISIASRPISSSSFHKDDDNSLSQNLHSRLFISSYVDSMLGHVGSSELLNPSSLGSPSNSPTPTESKSFSLPRIPTVSKFNDFLIEDENGTDIMFPANPSSILLYPNTPMARADSLSSSVHSRCTLPPQANDKESLKSHADVIVGPFEVFDLIKSDDDERFIIWGPDPILLSSSMATTSVERPSTYATLYNNQYRRPELKGFSSNTTSTLTRTRSLRWSERLSKETDHGSLLLKRALGLNKINQRKDKEVQDVQVEDVPKVIEAATVHKLIEKLTNTLDYTLMTDFFLTYRDFLNPQDLCQLLISRFYWALENDEESRRIVRIRTFVVLRHWLNNYFVHDFIGNRTLRIILTDFLNNLPHHPLVKESPRDQRIVKILKRVVRRLKKLYYNQSSGASRVKVILPPPPTAEQEQLSEIVRAKLSSSGIRRKTVLANTHNGNLAVQDARNAAVVVVGSVIMKSTSLIDSGVDSSARILSDDKTSSIYHRYDRNVHDTRDRIDTSSVMSVASDDSLDSELSAGDTLPNESDISDDHLVSQHHLVREDTEHDRDWVKEQQETLEYFRQAIHNPTEIDSSHKSIPDFSLDLTSDNSPPSSPTTPGHSGIKEPIAILTKDIRRVPSERWCKSDDEHPKSPVDSMPEDLPPSPVGLSKKLSKKSIERRKSEKNFQDSNISSSPSSVGVSTHSQPHQNIPDVPKLPTKLTKMPSKSKKNIEEEENPVEFVAIRYESTRVVDVEKEKGPTQPSKPSRALSKIFQKPPPTEASVVVEKEPVVVDEKVPIEASLPKDEKDEAQPRNSSQLVSLIAQQLRQDTTDDDHKCSCAKCSGNTESTSACRRLSAMILAKDIDRRHSLELRHRRGASIDKGLRRYNSHKPVYLGHLNARSYIHPSEDVESIASPSEKSIQTEAQASSSRARMSFISDMTSVLPRSKLIELGISETHRRPMSMQILSRNDKCFIMSYRTSRLAKQFCFIERDVLSKVGWEELIHCKWTKMDANGNLTLEHTFEVENEEPVSYTVECEKRRHREQGVEQVIQRFNTVCQWVAFEIVRTKNINERVKLIEKFIRLAKKCKMFSNYATLVQILLGLQSPAVARLEKTWAKVSPKCQKQLNKLTEFTSPMKNWKNIRDSMTEVAEEYGNSPAEVQVELPGTSSSKKFKKTTRIKIPFGGCIPFLGIYLSDLVFNSEKPRYLKPSLEHQRIYMANSTRSLPACLDEPLVNFRKHRVIATVIKRVLTFQNLATRYSFEEDPVLIEKCKYLQVLDATAIRELSHSLE